MKDLEKAFSQAAEIAKKVPKNLQEAAFNRALDELLGSTGPRDRTGSRTPSQRRGRNQNSSQTEDAVTELIDAIDRTKFPDIGATTRVADRALKVLQLAHNDHGVDGLTAASIADILSKKFRLPVDANAVRMALQRESETVDVRTGPGGSRVFHITAPGETYLERLRSGQDTSGAATKRKHKKKAAVKKTAAGRKKKATGKKKVGKKAPSTKTSRLGPKAALVSLMEKGFFNAPRVISDIQEELRHKRGHTFTTTELSPALVRCVRDESLTRERNESGQYEYTRS